MLFQKHASHFLEFTSAAGKVVEVVFDGPENERRFVLENTSQNDVLALPAGSDSLLRLLRDTARSVLDQSDGHDD